jgi:hypothetical protein
MELWSIYKIQFFSITGSFFLLYLIVRLIRSRKIKEEYSLLWIFFGVLFLLLSVFKPLLDLAADLVGIHYAPAALLLFLIMALFGIMIQFSVVVSDLSEKNRILVREIALLNQKVEKIEVGSD